MKTLEDYMWHFARRYGGEDTADNAVGKFFRDPFSSLVRESIQNSLDVAVDDSIPVEMEYRIGFIDIPDGSKFFELEKYVNGSLSMYKKGRAHENLKSMAAYLNELHSSHRLYYMEVSDSNTKGMDYEQDNDSTRFYSFAKCLGNSDKSNDTSGGSYGFGKAVFYNASKIRSILVSTMTPGEDGVSLFEGISSLSTSKIDGSKFEKTGYFCLAEDEEPTSQIEDIPKGYRRTRPGTSVYILGIDPNEEAHQEIYEQIKVAVIKNFWLSILGNKLTVKVDGDTIDSEKVISIAEELYGDGGKLNDEPYNPLPFIDAVKNANTDEKHIFREADIPILGKVRLYLKRDKRGNDRILYMRKTQMLIRNLLNGTNYGFYGVFVCDGENGNKVLRASEDPTHTQWVSTNCDTPEDTSQARKAIMELNKFVRTEIVNHFGGANSSSSDITGAQNYLFMRTAYEDTGDKEREAEYGEKTGKTTPEETGSPIATVLPPYKVAKQEPRIGIVNVNVGTAAAPGDGDLQRGKTDHPVHPTPTPPPPHPGPQFPQQYKEDPTGKVGHFSRQIPVHYHFFFKKEDDGLFHYVVITSENEVEDCTLYLTATGDYGRDSEDNQIFVVDSDSGNLKKGVIYNLHLNAGKTTVKVRFEDNLKHSIKLAAYENQ